MKKFIGRILYYFLDVRRHEIAFKLVDSGKPEEAKRFIQWELDDYRYNIIHGTSEDLAWEKCSEIGSKRFWSYYAMTFLLKRLWIEFKLPLFKKIKFVFSI